MISCLAMALKQCLWTQRPLSTGSIEKTHPHPHTPTQKWICDSNPDQVMDTRSSQDAVLHVFQEPGSY